MELFNHYYFEFTDEVLSKHNLPEVGYSVQDEYGDHRYLGFASDAAYTQHQIMFRWSHRVWKQTPRELYIIKDPCRMGFPVKLKPNEEMLARFEELTILAKLHNNLFCEMMKKRS